MTTLIPEIEVTRLQKQFDFSKEIGCDENQAVRKEGLERLFYLCTSDEQFKTISTIYLYQSALQFGIDVEWDLEINKLDLIVTSEQHKWIYTYDHVFIRERESWHMYFMRMANRASERTTCMSGRKVGAVFVRDKIPLMSGFNGVPSGTPHPKVCPRIEQGLKSGEGLHLCPCNHAEQNAIGQAAGLGITLKDSTLYVDTLPCISCMGALTIVKPARVVYDKSYPQYEESLAIAKAANIDVVHIGDLT